MKNARALFATLMVAVLPASLSAQEDSPNRFTFSARFGLNIKAKFEDVGAPLANSRTTPDHLPFNYEDGYVLTDNSGNAGGQTWNWGYDRAGQKSGDTILFSRSTSVPSAGSHSFSSDPAYGGELVFSRQLGVAGRFRYGIEVAANYSSVSLNENGTVSGNATRMTDAYPFTTGTTPPQAPYQGTFNGPGFLIGDQPVNSMTTVISGATLTDHRQFDSDIWGFRLGPYVEVPLWRRLSLAASAGLAFGLLDNSISSERTLSLPGSGSMTSFSRHRDQDVLWGGYAGASLSWALSPHWSAVAGAQYQNLGTYQHLVGNRRVELDLGNSVFMTLGLGYRF